MTFRLRVVVALFTGLLVLGLAPQASSAQPKNALSATTVRAGNLRAQPSTTASIVTGLNAGTAISAQARSGDWARVTVVRTGARGWMIRSLLSLSASQFTSLPSEGNAAPASAPAQAAIPVSGVGGTTVLLMGVDRRPGETSARADALLLLRLDSNTGAVSLLSLPRDMLVRVPGVGNTRINSGYLYGGIALQKQTVSEFLGVRIDYAVAVNFGGFAGLIDALGGVTINVPRRLVDNAYPTDTYGTIKVVFEPGVQKMDGARALIYARTRHPDSDFGRMHRQQQVINAIGTRLKSLGAGGTLARAGSITSSLSDFVAADMSVAAGTNVLWDAWRYGQNPQFFVIDQNYVSMGKVNGADVLIPNRPAILRLVNRWAGR